MSRRRLVAWAMAGLAVAFSACSPIDDRSSGEPTDVRTYTYAQPGGVKLKADVCAPPGSNVATPLPAIVLLHGGGFIEGSRSSMRSLCKEIAAAGYIGVAIDYRLLPENIYPTQVEDARTAVEWLADTSRAERLGVDAKRIGMLGSSAGAIVAATLAAEGDTDIKVVAALSPVADMTPAGLSLGAPSEKATESVLAYLGCSDIADCPSAAEASPLTHVFSGSVPMFLAVGADELVPQGQVRALYEALQKVGVESELVVGEGSKHGQQLLSSAVRQKLFTFLSDGLR